MRIYIRYPLFSILFALAMNAALIGFLGVTEVAARDAAAPLAFASDHEIVITKTVVGASPAISWTFLIESVDATSLVTIPQQGGASYSYVNLSERTITITEQSQTGYLVSHVCYREQGAELSYEFEEIARGDGNQVVLSGFGEFDIVLHCEFTNIQLAQVTITKEADPADGTDFVFDTDLPFVGPSVFDSLLGGPGEARNVFSARPDIAIDSAGNIIVADQLKNLIQKFDSAGNFLRAWGWGVSDGAAEFQICTAGCLAGIAGNGAGQFDLPNGIAVDNAGNVYVADYQNDRVQIFDNNGAFLDSWGSTGTEQSQFNRPGGIAFDSAGNVYIVDGNNHRVQKFAADGAFILMWGRGVRNGASTHQVCTLADIPCQQGSQGAGNGQMRFPHSIAINSADQIYISDRNNNRIQRFTADGDYVDQWDGSDSESGAIDSPRGIALDAAGNLFIVDNGNSRVIKLADDWSYLTEWGTEGWGPGFFFEPVAIALAADGAIYVSDDPTYLVQKFIPVGLVLDHALPDDSDSVPISATVYITGGQYTITETDRGDGWSFVAVSCDSAGPGSSPVIDGATVHFDLVLGQSVTCTYTNRGRGDLTIAKQVEPDSDIGFELALTSLVTRTWRIPFHIATGPNGLAVDSSDQIYVADIERDQIVKYDSDLTPLLVWGSHGTGEGQFDEPTNVAVDGNNDIYVADTENSRIQKFDDQGSFIQEFGTAGSDKGQLLFPESLVVDSSNNVYVLDIDNNRIVKFSGDGLFERTWGWGVLDGSNTFQICTSANPSCKAGINGQGAGQFEGLQDIAITSDDRLYVLDEDRIQIFDPSGGLLDTIANTLAIFEDPTQVAIDALGNVYVAFDDSTVLARYSNTGEFQDWVRFLSSEMDTVLDLIFDSQGAFVAAGADVDSNTGVLLRRVIQTLAGDESHTFDDLPVGRYTVIEDLPEGWRIASATCQGSDYVPVSTGVSLNIADGAEVVCTIENEQLASLAIVKQTEPAAGAGFDFAIDGPTHSVSYLGQWGAYGTGTAQFDATSWITVDADGNVYVSDDNNHRIQKFDSHGNFLRTWGWGVNGGAGFEICTAPGPCLAGVAGDGAGQFDTPNGAVASVALNRVYVADGNNPRIQVFDTDGSFLFMWGWGVNGGAGLETCDTPGLCSGGIHGNGAGQFFLAQGIALDSAGNVYVADSAASRIQKFASNGDFLSMWGSGVNGGSGFEICTIAANCTAASDGSGAGEFSWPSDIAVDGSDAIYIVDSGNNNVSKFDSDGAFQRTWGWGVNGGVAFEICLAPGPCYDGESGASQGQFDNPHGIFADSNGNVYIADDDNNRIQIFDSEGNFATQLGQQGSNVAEFDDPDDVAVHDSGLIYVVEEDANRVQIFTQFPTSFSLDDDQTIRFMHLSSGEYTLSETNLPTPWQLQSASCTNGDALDSITLDAGDIVTCTLTNVILPTLTVVKETEGGDGLFEFASPQLGIFSMTTASGISQTTFTVDASAYAITETIPSGWNLASAICDDDVTPQAISLDYGENVTCIFTNQKLATITVVKQTEGGDGTFNFTSPQIGPFSLTTTAGMAQATFTVDAGAYAITETLPATWNLSDASCTGEQSAQDIFVTYGDEITCTFTNTYIEQSLTVEKVVVGGSLDVDDFPLFIDDTQITNGQPMTLPAGDYLVSESSNPTYTAAYNGDCDANGNISLAIGEHLLCTITNTYIEQSLTVEKVVVGGSLDVDDFPLFIDDTQITSGQPMTLPAGDYLVSESSNLTYVAAYSGDCDANGNVSLAIGEHLLCTITNTYIEQSLTVEKIVIGGPLDVDDFPLFIDDTQVTSGQPMALPAGDYLVSETSDPAYVATFSGDCDANGNISLAIGEHLLCTITNTYIEQSLTVEKIVIGGPLDVDDFPLFINETQVASGQPMALPAGDFVISESTVSTYTAAFGGACDTDGNVTLEIGQHLVCTITNTAQPATLTVIKAVVGGPAPADWTFSGAPQIGDFTLPAAGGQQSFTLSDGHYTISETLQNGYVPTVTCTTGAIGVSQVSVDLTPGDDVTCTFVNQKELQTASVGIVVTKTVGMLSDQCGLSKELVVPVNATVYYCFAVSNTGDITLTNHTVVDNLLGGFTFTHELAPGETVNTVNLGFVLTDTADITKTNIVTWTANNRETSANEVSASTTEFVQVSATDEATIIPAIAAISVTKVAGLSEDSCSDIEGASVSNGTAIFYCITILNTGQITLTHHRVIDPMLQIDTTIEHALAPGSSLSITSALIPTLGPYMVTDTITNSATVQSSFGSDQGIEVEFLTGAGAEAPVIVSAPTGLPPSEQPSQQQDQNHSLYLPILVNPSSLQGSQELDAGTSVGGETRAAEQLGNQSAATAEQNLYLSVILSSATVP